MKSVDIIVCGGGISGISTAIVLQSLGWRVGIVAAEFPLHKKTEITPEIECCWRCWRSARVATTYAMASAYPHNLRVKNLARISDDSQAVFASMFAADVPGMDIYRMFEVFEKRPEPAPLALRRMEFEDFEGIPEVVSRAWGAPYRPGAEYLWGWTFKTFFVDMPDYVPFLWQLFEARGGIMRFERLTRESILSLAAGRPVVDCLGISAKEVFNDSSPAVIVRGRQVLAVDAPIVRDRDGLPLAYNYTPAADVFSRDDGEPEYVHFFPRCDGWLLGQTREPGMLDEFGHWHGAAVRAKEIDVNGQPIPEPILTLNEELLNQWIGKGFQGMRIVGREGYRYYRDPQGDGMRLDVEQIDGTKVFHNYGHGGSGITMTWGCAIQVGRMITEELGSNASANQHHDRDFDDVIHERMDTRTSAISN